MSWVIARVEDNELFSNFTKGSGLDIWNKDNPWVYNTKGEALCVMYTCHWQNICEVMEYES